MLAPRRRSARRARGGPAAARAAVLLPAVLLAAGVAGTASCDRGRFTLGRRGGEPATEFLAVAGDSTYWVTSGPGGVRVRTAPLFLTRWGGRLADVYVVNDRLRFDDAEFTTVRVYRRDLLSGDSTLVVDDAEVPGLAARYAAAHPEARPLDDEDDPDTDAEPALAAEHGVALVAVHGPYLTLDLRTTVDGPDGSHQETLRRRVVDLRTGRPASLAALFGPAAPRALVAAGRRAFAAAVATLDTLPTPADAAADTADSTVESAPTGRARAALASLRFDPDNFGLTAVAGAPAVQFVARGADADGAVTLALPAVPVAGLVGPAPAEPAWWASDVRPLLPSAAPDAERLLARVLGSPGHPPAAGASGESPAGEPPAGGPPAEEPRAESLVRLDRPPADRALRRALRRAFDERALDDAVATSVARRHRAIR